MFHLSPIMFSLWYSKYKNYTNSRPLRHYSDGRTMKSVTVDINGVSYAKHTTH